MLFALARLIASPLYSGWALVLLLSTDVVWAVTVTLLTDSALLRESTWIRVNLVTTPLLALRVWFLHGTDDLPFNIAAIALTCSVVDYSWSWDYYFPRSA